jgi:hypothetical protein
LDFETAWPLVLSWFIPVLQDFVLNTG